LCVVSSKEQQLYLGMPFHELQNSGVGKKIITAEIHAKDLGLPKIVMTVISVRDIDCLVQTKRL
jgi:hypothetical protein